MNTDTLTERTSAALAKIDDIKAEDFDFIGQKYPHISHGHKSMIYFGIAVASLPAQPAWAVMSLIAVPVSVSIAAAAMGVNMLLKSAANDADDEGNAIEVEAKTVGPETKLTAVEATAEPVFEANPFSATPIADQILNGKEYYNPDLFPGVDEPRQANVEEIAAIVQSVPAGIVKSGKQPMDIAKYMAMNPKPTLISAVPRSGKGVVQAQMWREFKALHPNGIVWVIQPKPASSELGYWEGVNRFWGEMIEDALGDTAEISRISKELSAFVKEWRQQPQRPKMLVIDEAVKIQSVLKSWYSNFLVPTIQVEASSGETDERYLYVVSQSPLVKDIGISTGNRSSLQLLHIHKPGEGENLAVLRGSFNSIPEPESDLHEVSSSPKQAIFYHTGIGEWYPLPNYPVYERSLVTVGGASSPVQSAGMPEQFPEKDVWANVKLSWEFEEDAIESWPNLDRKITEFRQLSKDPRYECVADFLESLKEHGDCTQLSPSDFGKSTWASRWNGKPGGLKDRSGDSVAVFIKNTVKLGFLKEVDGKYKVQLS